MKGRATTTLLLALLASAIPASADGSRARPGSPALRERVEVGLVRWPILVEPRSARVGLSTCGGVEPGDILIEEDGLEMRVLHVERARLPTLHALVFDVSGSMRGRMDWARQAARAYVDGLPADEKVMLVAFSEDPLVLVPPTRERARLLRAIDQLEPVHNTALWGALYATMRLVEALPERPVIVLITDGEDTTSLEGHDAELVLAKARSMRDIGIYPVTLRLPTSPSIRGGENPRFRLAELARETGGRHVDVRDADGLEEAFRRVRRRIDAEWWAAYVPPHFGEGPRDDPARPSRDRRVIVRGRKGAACRVSSAGPTTRRSGGGGGDEIALEEEEPARGLEGIGRAYRLHPTAGWGLQSSGRLLVPSEQDAPLRLRVPGIVHGAGLLYADRRAGRRPRTRLVEAPTYAEVDALVARFDLERLREHVDSPLAVFLALEQLGGLGTDRSPLSPYVLEGQTLLEYREQIGLALFFASGQVRDWASEALARDEFERLRAQRAQLGSGVPGEARLFAALRVRARNPDPLRVSTRCGAWLGDVRAIEIASELDLRSARAWHEAHLRGSPPPPAPLASWNALRSWLRPATVSRVVAPLVPAWSEAEGVLGFYRFVLPTPNRYGGPGDLPPPLMLGRPLLRAARERGVTPRPGQTLESLAYEEGPASRRAARALPSDLGGDAGRNARFRVRLELGGEGARALAGWFTLVPGPGGELRAECECLEIEGDPALEKKLGEASGRCP